MLRLTGQVGRKGTLVGGDRFGSDRLGMEFLERLIERTISRHLDTVLVGGYALLAWGVSRQTADIDLLIPDRDRSSWKELLTDLGYGVPHEKGSFVQYAAPTTEAWPVDLVIVNPDTFDRVTAEATPARFGRVVCPVASVSHLLAMKFHALRYVPHRAGHKDLADAYALIRRTGGRVTDPAVRDLCLKYGSKEIYDRLTGNTHQD